MSKKKPTPGERIANVPEHGDPLYHDMTDVELATARALASRIDAAIRREVKKAVEAERSMAQTKGWFDVIHPTKGKP
jgi:hypothetical protein